MNASGFTALWYLHVPSLLLVALIYLLIARGLVAAVFGWDSRNVLARLVSLPTRPVLLIVGALTPRSVPRAGVLLFAIVWLFVALGLVVWVLAISRARPLWA